MQQSLDRRIIHRQFAYGSQFSRTNAILCQVKWPTVPLGVISRAFQQAAILDREIGFGKLTIICSCALQGQSRSFTFTTTMTSNATMNCCLAIASAARLKSGGVDGIADFFERELQLPGKWLKVSRQSAISYNKNHLLQPGNPAHDKFQQCLDSLPDEADCEVLVFVVVLPRNNNKAKPESVAVENNAHQLPIAACLRDRSVLAVGDEMEGGAAREAPANARIVQPRPTNNSSDDGVQEPPKKMQRWEGDCPNVRAVFAIQARFNAGRAEEAADVYQNHKGILTEYELMKISEMVHRSTLVDELVPVLFPGLPLFGKY